MAPIGEHSYLYERVRKLERELKELRDKFELYKHNKKWNLEKKT